MKRKKKKKKLLIFNIYHNYIMTKVGKYNYEKSPVKNKKLRVVVNGKRIDFGDSRYQHFKDRTGLWSQLDHNDKKRRANYRARAKGALKKDGTPAYLDPSQPAWHSYHILW